MWDDIKDFFLGAILALISTATILFSVFATFLAVVGTFLLVFICQPFFWVAIVAIVLIMDLL